MSERPIAPALAVIGAIVAANVATSALGMVTWLGVAATAGTWLAGLALVARDWLHETGGARWVLPTIIVGAILSAALSPQLALASGVAFLLAELADWAIYAPLRRKGRTRAALASNVVGSIVDSAVFLALAGFPMALLGTQSALKIAVSTATVLGVRLALSRQPVHAASGGRHA